MISILTLGVVNLGFHPWSCQIKDYEIGIYCFSAKHTALKGKSWLAWNQNMSLDHCFSELAVLRTIKHVSLVQCGHHYYHFIECNFLHHDKPGPRVAQ